MTAPAVRAVASRLALPPLDGAFSEDEVAALPEPVRRYLLAAIGPGAALARAARLAMRGRIKLGARWLPFRATETLAPHEGFVWAGRVAGLVSGSDRYADGEGRLDWKLLGLVRVAHGEGADVARSAAGRAAGEAVWLPTTLLPRFGVRWDATDDHHLTAAYRVGDLDVVVDLEIDGTGALRRVTYDRWGDPDQSGEFGVHGFGLLVTGQRRFGDLTIPAEGRVGWFPGTQRWDEGEFFRYRITRLDPVT